MSKSETGAPAPRRGRGAKAVGGLVAGLLLVGLGGVLHSLFMSGPGGPPPGLPMGASGPPAVVVERVSRVPLNPAEAFIGHVEAVESVDLAAHVQGYIQTVHFTEGGLVEAGDLLVTIRQADFRAQVAQRDAALAQAGASLAAAEADVQAGKADLDAAQADQARAQKYLKRLQTADARSVVQANLDTAEADDLRSTARVRQAEARLVQAEAQVKQATAAIERARADLDLARITLGYTEIRAPISGRIGRALYTPGDLVGPSSGALARVVQVDPIRVVFSPSDRQYLSMFEGAEAGMAQWRIGLRLPNGETYTAPGQWDFANNEMNLQTGAIPVRVRFPNARGLLVPGSYVTVLMKPSDPAPVLVVPEAAIRVTEQGPAVFVVGPDGVAASKPVTVGRMVNGVCEIVAGLEEGESVVVQGLQKVRSGQAVTVLSEPAPEGRPQ